MAETGTTFPERMLVADLDPLSQTEHWLDGTPGRQPDGRARPALLAPSPAAAAWWSGVLRTSDLFGSRVTLLDVQVLDGIFFLESGPTAVDTVLGRSPLDPSPITVTARDGDLGESLRRLALRPDGSLSGFEWSALRAMGRRPRMAADAGAAAAARLGRCPVDEVPRVLAGLLAQDHGEEPWSEPTGIHLALAHAWEAWIGAQESGRLTVTSWQHARFDLPGQLAATPLPPAVPEQAALRLRELSSRSALHAELSAGALSDLTEAAARDAEAWWRLGYARALAAQHRAGWFQLDPRWGLGGATSTSSAVQLEHRAVEILGAMPAAVFATTRHRARSAIADWEAHPSQRASDALGYAVREAGDELDLGAVRRATWIRLASAVTPILLGLVALARWESPTVGLLIGASAAAIELVAVTVSELVGLHRTSHSSVRAFVDVPGIPR